MEEKTRKMLADRFGYETWRGVGGEEGIGLIRGFAFAQGEVPGWTVARTEHDVVDSQPRLRLILRRSNASDDQLIAIKAVQCPSVAAARTYLLKVLGEFQSPLVARRADADIGEVAFDAGATMVVFSRANMVVHVANAGRDILPVHQIARAVDARLTALGEQNRGDQP